MKSLLEYKNLIMSTGLIPAIVCMIFCIFFQDAAVFMSVVWVALFISYTDLSNLLFISQT